MNFVVLVLAAGQSRRFGTRNKLLAGFGGEPLILRTLRRLSLLAVPAHTIAIAVVTGPKPSDVASAIERAGFTPKSRLIANQNASDGMGSSIAAGITALDETVDAAVIVPGDMPFVSAGLIERLIAAFLADGGQRPAHPVLPDGTQMSPVVWPRALFASLSALSGDKGGKSLLLGRPALTVTIRDAHELADVDTPEELDRLQRLYDGA